VAGYVWPFATQPLDFTQNGSTLFFEQDAVASHLGLAPSDGQPVPGHGRPGFDGVQVATTNQFVFDPGSFYNISFTVDLAAGPARGLTSTSPSTTASPPSRCLTPVVVQARLQLTGTLTETGDSRNRPLGGWTVFIDLNGNRMFRRPRLQRRRHGELARRPA
jgi:hypothetical protein